MTLKIYVRHIIIENLEEIEDLYFLIINLISYLIRLIIKIRKIYDAKSKGK